MFFDNWKAFLQIFISCISAYFIFIIWLRISGKRTLSKWNAFDFIVTISLGSILATVVLSKDTVIFEGIFAAALLIALQFIITFFSVRFDWIESLIKAKPTLLFDKGEFLSDEMKKQRVTKSEILAAIRSSGSSSLKQVEAVVLETDGSFSVIGKSEKADSRELLQDVEGAEIS